MARKKPTKRAIMRLVYIDFWSALKMSFLVSLIVAAVIVVIALVVWQVLEKVGAVASMRTFLESVAGAQGASLVAGLTFGNFMTFTLVVALLELIVVTAMGAILAALFNLATHIVGGWKITFGSD